MSIDLSGLSAKELGKLITSAKKEHARIAKRIPAATVRTRLVKLAKAEGYTIAELFGDEAAGSTGTPTTRKAAPRAASSRAGRKLGKVAPKYRNPANARETWSGRGKQPRWLATYVRQGKSASDYLIEGVAIATAKKVPANAKKSVVKKAA